MSALACGGAPPPDAVAPPEPGEVDMLEAEEPTVEAPPPPEAGNVRLSSAMMTGGQGMSKDAGAAASKAFVQVFDEGKAHFRRCYAPALERDPKRAGTIDVRVILQQDGSIYELVLVASDVEDPVLTDCVVGAFRKLKYQPLQDGELFSVTAPVKLSPE